jgi:hypothetical protein
VVGALKCGTGEEGHSLGNAMGAKNGGFSTGFKDLPNGSTGVKFTCAVRNQRDLLHEQDRLVVDFEHRLLADMLSGLL